MGSLNPVPALGRNIISAGWQVINTAWSHAACEFR